MLGWLAALPTLIGVLALLLEATGADRMMVGDPLQDPDAYRRLPARLVDFTRGTALLIGFSLPFSAGVIIFGLAFPLVMAVRGGWRRLRGLRAPP